MRLYNCRNVLFQPMSEITKQNVRDNNACFFVDTDSGTMARHRNKFQRSAERLPDMRRSECRPRELVSPSDQQDVSFYASVLHVSDEWLVPFYWSAVSACTK